MPPALQQQAVQAAEEALTIAHYDNWGTVAEAAALGNLLNAQRGAETTAETIARLERAVTKLLRDASQAMTDQRALAKQIAFCLAVPEGWSGPRNPELAISLERQRNGCDRLYVELLNESLALQHEINALAEGMAAQRELQAHLAAEPSRQAIRSQCQDGAKQRHRAFARAVIREVAEGVVS